MAVKTILKCPVHGEQEPTTHLVNFCHVKVVRNKEVVECGKPLVPMDVIRM